MLVNSSSRNLGMKTAPAIAAPMPHDSPMDEVKQDRSESPNQSRRTHLDTSTLCRRCTFRLECPAK
jgi:hypothetical protein